MDNRLRDPSRGISRRRRFKADVLVVVIAAFFSAGIPSALAQGNASVFDVAAIHLSRASDPTAGLIDYTGTQLRADGVSVAALLKFAYQVRDHQITGGPDWMKTTLFDIDAGPIAAGFEGVARTRLMLQALLRDRFGLQIRRESLQQPIYKLVVSKSGSRLKNADANTVASFRVPPGAIEAAAMPVSTLVTLLINQVGRTVIDETHLAGRYEFQLHFAVGLAAEAGSADPSLFTALEEQLGLRLEPARGPVEMLVVDRLEKPSEN